MFSSCSRTVCVCVCYIKCVIATTYLTLWPGCIGTFFLKYKHDDNRGKLKLFFFIFFDHKAHEARFGWTWGKESQDEDWIFGQKNVPQLALIFLSHVWHASANLPLSLLHNIALESFHPSPTCVCVWLAFDDVPYGSRWWTSRIEWTYGHNPFWLWEISRIFAGFSSGVRKRKKERVAP